MNKPTLKTIKGAKVALYPMKEVEAVTVVIRFNAGSWYEEENWGAHHLLEHVMFDGGEKFKSEEEVELFKEQNGLSTNGSTGRTALEFFVRAPKIKIKEGLDVLFDTVFNPNLRQSDIEREKTIIAQEYKDKWSNPQMRFGKAESNNLFGVNHPYTRDGMGEIEYVKTLSRRTLQKIHTKYCTPQNATIVVVGNFNEEEVLKFLKQALENIPTGKEQTYKIPDIKTNKYDFSWKEDVQKVAINVDWVTNKFNDKISMKDKLATRIGSYILGGSSRSMLTRELRTKRGWVYSVSAGRSFFPTLGSFYTTTSTDAKKAKEVCNILISTANELAKLGVQDEEFERARNFLKMQTLIGFDSVGAIAAKLMDDLFFEGQIYMPEDLIKMLDKIKKETVLKHISTFLENKPVVSTLSDSEIFLR